MFEQSLLAQQKRVRSRLRVLFVPTAIALHLAVGVGVVLAQYWTIEPVAEPPIQITFLSAAPAPPPAPPPPPPPAASTPKTPKPTPTPTQPVQPVEVPEEIPPADVEPADGGEPAGEPGGVPGGVAGGVAGGVVGGVLGGVPGGVVGGTGDEILRVGGAITAPEAIKRVQPVYTEAARRARIQGVVIVEAIIDVDGNVVDVRVLKPLPLGLDRAAVEAVKDWKFRPARLNGRAVKVYFSLTVNFRLQ